jgi:3-hydroxyacyl-CoA dehydrogenase
MKLENIKIVACVGAGVIGHSWACCFAQRGYTVRLMDINQDVLNDIPEKVRANYEVFIKKGLLTHDELEATLKRIKIGSDISWAVESADFCIESVLEDLSLKKDVFTQMDKFAPKRAILASSTSSQSITEIGRVTGRPEKCITMHPLNPPHIIPAVEVVRGKCTSEETTSLTVELLKKIRRKPYVCMKEVPGFVMTRLMTIILREALSLLNRGVASVEDIDTAINAGVGLRFGLMGIFEINNLTSTGGLEMFLKKYSESIRHIWADIEELKEIPSDLAEKAVAGIKDELRGKSPEEIIRWRDEKLLELMKIRDLI